MNPSRWVPVAVLVVIVAGPNAAWSNPDCLAGPPLLQAPFTAVELPDGTSHGLVVGSVTNPGSPDLLSIAENDGSITILSVVGDGTLQCVGSVPADDPSQLTIGRINGDTRMDMIVTHRSSNTVSVLVGLGFGAFATPVSYATGSAPTAVVAARFNTDAFDDLAVGTATGVTVHRNDGAGALLPGVTYPTGGSVDRLAVADLNGDHVRDLVAGSSASPSVSVLIGHGDATFSPAVSIPTGAATALRLADVNGDANVDLIILDSATERIEIRAGIGDGTFGPPRFIPLGTWARDLAIADLDADGRPDFAVVLPRMIGVLLNADEFATLTTYSGGPAPGELGVCDLNGDGNDDLAVLDSPESLQSDLSLLVSNPGGGMGTHRTVGTSPLPRAVYFRDFDGDGRNDLAVLAEQKVDLFLGISSGMLSDRRTFPAPMGFQSAVGDVNGDGLPDIVSLGSSTVSALLARTDGTFSPAVTSFVDSTGSLQGHALGDVTGDGVLDLVVGRSIIGSAVLVLPGHGDGSFGPATIVGGFVALSVAVVDFDADGNGDIVYGTPNGYVVGLRNDGGGIFTAYGTIRTGSEPHHIVVADVTHDGRPDLAIGAPLACGPVDCVTTSSVCFAVANASGFFDDPTTHQGGDGAVEVGDIDGDGNADLASIDYESNTVAVLRGDGQGRLGPRTRYGVGFDPASVAIGDITGDGRGDVFVANYSDNTVSILTSGVGVLAAPVPEVEPHGLAWVAPNPVRDEATIGLTLPRAGRLRVTLLDAQGRVLRTVVNGAFEAGEHRLHWNTNAGARLAPGVYFVVVRAPGLSTYRRVVVID